MSEGGSRKFRRRSVSCVLCHLLTWILRIEPDLALGPLLDLTLLIPLLHVVVQNAEDLVEVLPQRDVPRRLVLLVAHALVAVGLQQDPGEFPPAHGGGDVQRRVAVLVLLRDATLCRYEDSNKINSAKPLDARPFGFYLVTPAWPYLAAVCRAVSP